MIKSKVVDYFSVNWLKYYWTDGLSTNSVIIFVFFLLFLMEFGSLLSLCNVANVHGAEISAQFTIDPEILNILFNFLSNSFRGKWNLLVPTV